MMRMTCLWACLLVLVQTLVVRGASISTNEADVPTESDGPFEENLDLGPDPTEQLPPPMFAGGPNWGHSDEMHRTMQERMQNRLADLKAQFEALNETEKAAIKEKAEEMREKIAMMPPPPPPPHMMCPPPEPCDCEDDDDEDEDDDEEYFVPGPHPIHYQPPQPWWRRPAPHPYGMQQGQNWQQMQYQQQMQQQGHYGHRFHGPMNTQDHSEGTSHRSRRDLARLKKTFSVTNPNEWWQDIDFGRGNAVSDSIASWDLGAATQHSISSAMDHYAPALHIGTINRGSIMHPAMGGPADRIFGYNPDFNRQDMHAFKFKPRGQFQQYQNKPLDYFKSMKYLPAGAEFFYNPNPQLRPALTGVSVNPGEKSVYSDKFLSQNPGQNLPRGTYKLEWIQLVPTADKTKVQGFNMVVKNSQTGQHFRLNNADVNQFQGASPYRQHFNRVAHQWGGHGLAQGPTGSVYDRNLPGYRIDSGQRYYNNYYGTPHYYKNSYYNSQLPSKI